MSVTEVPTPRELLFSQVDRLVNSSHLRSSESLCRLLRYLAERSAFHAGEPVKEYQIATEVMGRAADFDPRLDAAVRVQTGRLRAKLGEYYATEGIDDDIILDIPRGAYSLAVHPRTHSEAPALDSPQPVSTPANSSTQPHIESKPILTAASFALTTLSVLCLGLTLTLALMIVRRSVPPAAVTLPTQRAPLPLRTIWQGFIEGPESPLVVFSNAEFVGRPETGMRYFDPLRDSRASILDHYTGVGEVLAIHELDRLFTLLRHDLRVKRGRLLSLDDAKSNDLIFVGSPSENLTLREVPMSREFVFRRVETGARKGDLIIVNLKPRPGEAAEFLGSGTVPLSVDYAVVGLVPGMNPGLSVMILAGLTTLGTHAAVEFVCRERYIHELLLRTGVSPTGEVPPFEAVIRVKVTGGVPVASELVAVHPYTR